MRESRLKWYGYVLRRDEYVGKRVMVMEVSEKRRRGRPKRRWLDNIKNDMSERGSCQGRKHKDRVKWRRLKKTSTPTCTTRYLFHWILAIVAPKVSMLGLVTERGDRVFQRMMVQDKNENS